MKALLIAAVGLLGVVGAGVVGAARGQEAAGWTRFTDPTEHAFTVAVPTGWSVTGGIAHRSSTELTWFVTAISPDGGVQVSIGDPGLGPFTVPSAAAMGQAAASAKPPPRPRNRRAAPAPRPDDATSAFRTGSVFAADYGREILGRQKICEHPRVIGEKQQPRLPGTAEPASADFTTGDAFVICPDSSSVGYALATTARTTPTAASWRVVALADFVASAAQAPGALSVLETMLSSWKFDPAWRAATEARGIAVPDLTEASAPAHAPAWALWRTVLGASNKEPLADIADLLCDRNIQICPGDRRGIR